MSDDYREFCHKLYLATWEEEFQKKCQNQQNPSAIQSARQAAQRQAIITLIFLGMVLIILMLLSPNELDCLSSVPT